MIDKVIERNYWERQMDSQNNCSLVFTATALRYCYFYLHNLIGSSGVPVTDECAPTMKRCTMSSATCSSFCAFFIITDFQMCPSLKEYIHHRLMSFSQRIYSSLYDVLPSENLLIIV